jgi:glycerol kinase
MVGNELLMQFQADIIGREVVRPAVHETTALGAAYAAGLATAFFEGVEELRSRWTAARTWKPAMDERRREAMYALWKKAVGRSFDWVEG